ncbi:MAG: hypothetical protein ACOCQD_05435, partial [archaeon]
MPENIIPVSSAYKENSKNRDRIFEHNITIHNVTTEQDITDYVDIQTFQINYNKTGLIGLISANTLSFDIELNINELDIDISDIIKKGDKIQLRNDYAPIGPILSAALRFEAYQNALLDEESFPGFTGIVQNVPEQYENLQHRFAIKAYDRIKNGIEAKFDDHVVKINWYLCNNNEPEMSLAHFCAYEMGFEDADLLFEDITDPEDNYITIPYAHFEEGNKVMAELRGMVESVQGNVFMNNDDKLM